MSRPKSYSCSILLFQVDRIVGQSEGTSMEDILQYRQQFYENNYDIRIIIEENESPESIVDKVKNAVSDYQQPRGFISTRGLDGSHKTFSDVVLEGLASDGGLYVNNSNIPRFSLQQWSRLVELTYPERALRMLERWIHPLYLSPSHLLK